MSEEKFIITKKVSLEEIKQAKKTVFDDISSLFGISHIGGYHFVIEGGASVGI